MNAFPVMSNKTKGNKIISTHLILFQSQTKGKITTTGASLNFSDLFRWQNKEKKELVFASLDKITKKIKTFFSELSSKGNFY